MNQVLQKGFTLIELMIVVAIGGILAAIAYPSYTESVMKSRRADAKAALLGLANGMERYFTVNNTYVGAGTVGTPASTGRPASTVYPIDSTTNLYYTITITTANASSYTLQAAPRSGSAQASDKCSNLTLTNTGQKGFTGSYGTQADCW
jgi:type IV pilus assembly protein PilE